MKARLLIIDPQNDFCDIPGAALPVAGANADMTRLAALMKQARDKLGDITVTLTVLDGIADLRGFFLDIGDFSLFDGLEVRGDDVTGFTLDDDDVINLKHGVNLNGGGSPCPCPHGWSCGRAICARCLSAARPSML